METIHPYISSKGGQAAIGEHLKTPRGKQMAMEMLPLVLDIIGFPGDGKKTVLETLERK